MAEAKDPLSSIKTGVGAQAARLGSILSRLPFVKKSVSSAPEPFSAIEDETPLGDLLEADNAAPVNPRTKSALAKPQLGEALRAAVKSLPVMIGIVSVLGFILILAVVSIIVSSPPRAVKAAAPFTKAGEALVKTWLPPPGDPLSPRMEMERSEAITYTPADAAKIGLPDDPLLMTTLEERNDASIEDLYGTVP
jgi:hypothetical protein